MNAQIELIGADGFLFPVYQALPQGPVLGAVVVLQEIFGVNAHIRAVADGYAALGYLALAPSTFHRVKSGVEMGYAPEDVDAITGVAMAHPEAARQGVMVAAIGVSDVVVRAQGRGHANRAALMANGGVHGAANLA